MKRHIDLITKLLRHVESDLSGERLEISNNFDGYTARQIHYHLALCEEADLLILDQQTSRCQDEHGQYTVYAVIHLTWWGHDFLDNPSYKRQPRKQQPERLVGGRH